MSERAGLTAPPVERSKPIHHIGSALGAEAGASDCVVCGASPFAASRPARETLGPNFTDWDLVAGGADMACDGCVRTLGGKPSRENPPLRMSHFVVAGGALDRVDGDGLLAVLMHPPADIAAVGWAMSRQKHASLRCGPCSPAALHIGCDHGTIEWVPGRDTRLLDAVSELRRVARQADIVTGAYGPHVIEALGLDRWRAAEAVAAGYRPSLHLDLAVALVRRPLPDPQEVSMPIPDEYRAAAEVLHPITRDSALRRDDPIRFWGELLPRRLAGAASSASLTEWLGYIVEALRVEAHRPEVVDLLERIDAMTEAEAAAVMGVLRRDHRLVITVTRMIGRED